MKKEKEKTSSPNDDEDKGTEVFKDFDFSKLNRDYIRVAPFDELLRLFRSQTPEFWLDQTQSTENPLSFLILALLAHSGKLTQNSCKDVINVKIVRISKNDKEYYNLYNLYNTYNLYNFYKNDNQTTVYLSRTFSKLLKDGLIEFAGTERSATRGATLYRITLKGIRRLFYYCLPSSNESKDLSETINELADEVIAFIEAYPPADSNNAIDLKKMLEFSYPLFELFKTHPSEFMDGLLPLVENRLDTKLPRQFCNFPSADSFEYSGPKSEALGHICHLEGSISSMTPPQTKITEIQAVCPSCGAKFGFSVVEQKPYLICKLCGSVLKIVSKHSEDFLVFSLRTDHFDYDLTVEASCGLVSEIKRIFEQNQACKILSILSSRPIRKNSNIEDFFYSLIAIEPILQKVEMIEDIKPLVLPELENKFCPEVVGLSSAKLALLASIVRAGRPRKDRLNVLLAGDPGVGKSYLIEQAQKYLSWLPVGFVDGGNASAVGVLGGAVRSSDSGGWSIVRGALPQASGGILFFEEMTNLSSETLDKFKQALESAKVCVAKAGLNVNFSAETSLFSACNPKLGVFNKKNPLFTQIPISAPLLDRLDLKIGVFQDETLTKQIAKKMISQRTESDENIDFVQKYLFRAHSLNPSFSDEAKKFFIEHCKYTPRQNRGLKNLALAIAQLRLSSSVSIEDMQTAFDFIQKQNKVFFGDVGDGATFENSAQQAILQLLDSQKEPIPEDTLIKTLNHSDEILIRNVIRTLKEQGTIYQTAKGLSRA